MALLTRTQAWVFLAGITAAAQIGKMPPLMPAIGPGLGLGLVAGAIAISLIEIGGALFGSRAARLAARLTERRTLRLALVFLALGGFGQALAPGAGALLAFRGVEALGYLGVIVSAPVLIARAAPRGRAGQALAIWSTFVAIGIALGATLAGGVADLWGWRTALALWAALVCAVLALGARVRLPSGAPGAAEARRPSRRAVVAALGFGGFTCFQVGLLALAPQYLVGARGFGVAGAGLLTGLGALATVTGAAAPLLLGRRLARGSSLAPLLAAALLLPPLAVFPFFLDLPRPLLAALFIGLNMVSGIFPALAFARLPQLSADGDVTASNGAIAQAGAAGSLLGPPVFAACVSLGGWQAAAGIGLAVSCLAFALSLRVDREIAAGGRG